MSYGWRSSCSWWTSVCGCSIANCIPGLRRHDAMALIRIEDVFVAYGTPSRAVLAGIDLDIEEGSFVCLLGQTRCGKSTLLRLGLGSGHPPRGRVPIDVREQPPPGN